MKLILQKSDILGALASSLCIIHCLATPFIFIAQTSIISGSETSPFWWRNLDYLFLMISFFAVARSTQKTSKKIMKSLLWTSWTILSLLILNEKAALTEIPEIAVYTTAATLAILHIYNLKFCQCKTDNCCTQNG